MPRGKTVYRSSDDDDRDLRKTQPRSGPTRSLPPNQQTALVRREVGGRGGKTVTTIRGLQLNPTDFTSLAKTLKQACGTGGTLKDGVIELQGDHRPAVQRVLSELGYKVKLTGG